MGVVMRGPSQQHYHSQRQTQKQQGQKGIAATARFIGANLLIGVPLALLFGANIPLWSLVPSTIGFAVAVSIASRNEGITTARSIFYNLVIFILTDTVGILIFGGGGMSAVFQSLAGLAVLIPLCMIFKVTRRILLFFVQHPIGKWVGYSVSVTAVTSLLGAIITSASPTPIEIDEPFRANLDTLAQTLPLANATRVNSAVIFPFESNGRAYIYVTSMGVGQIIRIPARSYSSDYNRVVSLLTRTPLDHDSLLSSKPGIIRDLLLSNKVLAPTNNVIVVVDGNLNSVNFNLEFPSNIVLRSVSTDIPLIQQNIRRVAESSAISPQNTRIVNGLPKDEQGLAKLEVEGKWSDWSPVYSRWQNVIAEHGYSEGEGNKPTDVLDAIASHSNVLIVVAHSDGSQIFFPDGSRLRIEDFSAFQEQMERDNPLIILFGCETAKIEGMDSFARRLISLGARAVVAPSTRIGAIHISPLLDSFLGHSAAGDTMLEALEKAVEDTSVFEMQNWIGYFVPNQIPLVDEEDEHGNS